MRKSRTIIGIVGTALAVATAGGDPPGWERKDWVGGSRPPERVALRELPARPLTESPSARELPPIPRLDDPSDPLRPAAVLAAPPKNSTAADADEPLAKAPPKRNPPDRKPTPLPKRSDPKADGKADAEPRRKAKRPPSPEPLQLPAPQGPTYALGWPTLVQLAEASGDDVRLQELKVHEAAIAVELAQLSWLPSLRLGITHLHHTGFIQEVQGQIVNANKNGVFYGPTLDFQFDPKAVARDLAKTEHLVRVRQGQLNRFRRQRFQDMAFAYVDLMAAQAGLAIIQETHMLAQAVVAQANEYVALELLEEISGQSFRNVLTPLAAEARDVDHQHASAGLRLAKELNLAPNCRLYAAAEQVAPLTLVPLPASLRPEDEDAFAAQARAYGPGAEEARAGREALEAQLCVARLYALAPTIRADIGYGLLHGGTGNSYGHGGDRFDSNVSAMWDVSDIFRGAQNRALFANKKAEIEAQRVQLERKLDLGARIACRESVHHAAEMARAAKFIDDLRATHRILQKLPVMPDPDDLNTRSAKEAWLNEIKVVFDLANARQKYLKSLVAYNKSQILLRTFLGGPADAVAGVPAAAVPAFPEPRPAPPAAPSNEPLRVEAAKPVGLAIPAARAGRGFGPVPKIAVDDR